MKTRTTLLVLLTTTAMLVYPLTFTSAAPVSSFGGPEAWEEQWNVLLAAGVTPQDVLKSINEIWATEKNWTSLEQDRVDTSNTSVWRFIDQTGRNWIATASAEPSLTKCGYAVVTLKIVSASTLSGEPPVSGRPSVGAPCKRCVGHLLRTSTLWSAVARRFGPRRPAVGRKLAADYADKRGSEKRKELSSLKYSGCGTA